MKPRMLDLFCGGGGASVGYSMAGFDVTGVDISHQPHYPFKFIRGDALTFNLDGYDIIHASPPCQRFSVGTPDRSKHPDLIDAIRQRLINQGVPYVIENVRHAPIRADIVICGCMVGLPRIKRRRHFEVNPRLFVLSSPCQHPGPVITVTGHGTTSGNRKTLGRNVPIKEMREVMGIDWMNRDELSEAIPPAYTKFIGDLMMAEMGISC